MARWIDCAAKGSPGSLAYAAVYGIILLFNMRRSWQWTVHLDKGLGGRGRPESRVQANLRYLIDHAESKLGHAPYAPTLTRKPAEDDAIAQAYQLSRDEVLLQ